MVHRGHLLPEKPLPYEKIEVKSEFCTRLISTIDIIDEGTGVLWSPSVHSGWFMKGTLKKT